VLVIGLTVYEQYLYSLVTSQILWEFSQMVNVEVNELQSRWTEAIPKVPAHLF